MSVFASQWTFGAEQDVDSSDLDMRGGSSMSLFLCMECSDDETSKRHKVTPSAPEKNKVPVNNFDDEKKLTARRRPCRETRRVKDPSRQWNVLRMFGFPVFPRLRLQDARLCLCLQVNPISFSLRMGNIFILVLI